MQRAVLESINVLTPAHAINHEKSFASVGAGDTWTASGYATSMTGQSTTDADNPANMAYVRYTAPAGSTVRVTPTFVTAVPAPTTSSDVCAHAHLEFAVYGIMTTRLAFFSTSRALFLASTGKYGRRVLNGVNVPYKTAGADCVVSSADSPSIPTGVTWGQNSYDLPFKAITSTTTLTEYIVPAQAASHGWGDCGFFLCFPSIRYSASRIK